MEYRTPYPLLDDMYKSLTTAMESDGELAEKHSDTGSACWPSLASIQVKEFDNETGMWTTKIEGTCHRKAYYQMMNVPGTETFSARSFKVTTLGVSAEGLFRQWFHGTDGYRVVFPDIRGRKLRFYNKERGIRGEVDLVIEHVETGTKFGVELKTYDGPDAAIELAGYAIAKLSHRANMRYIRVDDPKRNQEPFPKIDNLLQSLLYLEEFWDEGIKLWKLIYGARDKGPDVEFDITLATINNERVAVVNGKPYPQFSLKAIHARYKTLQKAIIEQKLPPRDYVPEYDADVILTGNYPKWMKDKVNGKLKDDDDPVIRDWRCRFCPYLTKCLNENTSPF